MPNIGRDPVTGEDRPIRFCPLCLQMDDHPRHVHVTDPDNAVARHMDCCAAAGCPDGSCVVQREGVDDKVVGAKFLAHIRSLDHDEVAAKIAALPNDPAYVASAPSVVLKGAEQA